MAFCIRSERKINLTDKENFPLGPGQYLKLPQKKIIPNPHMIPFGTSYPKTQHKPEVTPGPGSYNINYPLNNSISSLDVSLKSSISNQSTIDQSLLNIKGKINERLGFMTRVERFQPLNDVYKNPGPGAYNIQFNEEKSEDKNKIKYGSQKRMIPLQTGSLSRVVSIPSKKMNGYYLDYKRNKSEIIVDPLSLESTRGSTSSLVGPGSYEIKRKKKNNAINWEQTCYKKERQLKQEKEIEQKIISELHPMNESRRDTTYRNNFRAVFNQKKIFFKRLPNFKDMNLEGDGLVMDDVPGPGYYEKEFNYGKLFEEKDELNKTSHYPLKKRKVKKDEDSHFGSKSTRFLQKSVSYENLGPCTYFIQKNKFEPNKKLNIYNRLKTKSLIAHKEIDKEEMSEEKEIKAGPGSYNLSRGFVKEIISKHGILHSNENRFKSQEEVQNIPGPGSYLPQDMLATKIQSNLMKTFNKREDNDSLFSTEQMTLSQKQQSGTPGVGTYHPEIVGSIEYKNTLKSGPTLGGRKGFLASSNRFNFKPNNMVGPGDYSPQIIRNMGKSYTTKGFIDTNEKRFGISYKNNVEVGPGDYELNKNEWNKKTYNVLFFKKD